MNMLGVVVILITKMVSNAGESNPVCLGKALRCAEFSHYFRNYENAKGIDFTSVGYNEKIGSGSDTLVWIGCLGDNGCNFWDWKCDDDTDKVTFGSLNTTAPIKTLVGAYTEPNQFPSNPYPLKLLACTANNPIWKTHNAPIYSQSAQKLCEQLGYKIGRITQTISYPYCPKPEYNPSTGDWKIDYSSGGGVYGRIYECSGKCDAKYVTPEEKCNTGCAEGTSGSCMDNDSYNCIGFVETCPHGYHDCFDPNISQDVKDKCAKDCYPGTSGPCRHKNTGDNSCIAYNQNCQSGYFDCTSISSAKLLFTNNDLISEENKIEKTIELEIDNQFRQMLVMVSGLFGLFVLITTILICCVYRWIIKTPKTRVYKQIKTTTDADTEAVTEAVQ